MGPGEQPTTSIFIKHPGPTVARRRLFNQIPSRDHPVAPRSRKASLPRALFSALPVSTPLAPPAALVRSRVVLVDRLGVNENSKSGIDGRCPRCRGKSLRPSERSMGEGFDK